MDWACILCLRPAHVDRRFNSRIYPLGRRNYCSSLHPLRHARPSDSLPAALAGHVLYTSRIASWLDSLVVAVATKMTEAPSVGGLIVSPKPAQSHSSNAAVSNPPIRSRKMADYAFG